MCPGPGSQDSPSEGLEWSTWGLSGISFPRTASLPPKSPFPLCSSNQAVSEYCLLDSRQIKNLHDFKVIFWGFPVHTRIWNLSIFLGVHGCRHIKGRRPRESSREEQKSRVTKPHTPSIPPLPLSLLPPLPLPLVLLLGPLACFYYLFSLATKAEGLVEPGYLRGSVVRVKRVKVWAVFSTLPDPCWTLQNAMPLSLPKVGILG